MFTDKTENELEFNPDLKLKHSSSTFHEEEQRIDVSPFQIKYLNTPIQNDCTLHASELPLSTVAKDFVSENFDNQSRNKPNEQPYNDIDDDLEYIRNYYDLPFEKRRRLCKTRYTRNLERIPQVGWKKRIRGFFRNFTRRVRTYFST
ncbi:hypothetical protein NPIL_472711 [Nephila pilipes]|uniref:Uncharacterized protein n=1 Tax=Nephila pilipes TaxID=299642 RepID=A0A8X6TUQ3_NEPPI|nr:hypothetical protein NPIL_472711 [Nephila pilipes]